MKALVTGGAGFIGSNLVGKLVREGWDVTVLDNLMSGRLDNLRPFPGVEFVQGDIRDLRAVERAAEGASVVFHLAASVGIKRSMEMPHDDAEINVLGTLNVVEAVRRQRTRKLIFSSTACVYGAPQVLPTPESHASEPTTPYGVSKLCAEKNCLLFGKLYGFDAVCFRNFNVYGPNQRADYYGDVIPAFVERMLEGRAITIFGDGNQTRDFINVADVVDAYYIAAITPGFRGAFNLGSGTQVTINFLLAQISMALGRDPKVACQPERKGDVRDGLADIRLLREKLGFSPSVSLADGLVEYVGWVRDRALAVAA